jgi:hypothetical protein
LLLAPNMIMSLVDFTTNIFDIITQISRHEIVI